MDAIAERSQLPGHKGKMTPKAQCRRRMNAAIKQLEVIRQSKKSKD